MTANELTTLPEAAKRLGIPLSTLRRAAKQKIFPVYQPFNSRFRVRVSEIEAIICETCEGDAQ